MAKIFDFDARFGEYIDRVTDSALVNTNGRFVTEEKGLAWRNNGLNGNINFSPITLSRNSSTIEIWFKRDAALLTNEWLLGSIYSAYRTIRFIGNTLTMESDTNGDSWVSTTIDNGSVWNHLMITANNSVIITYLNNIQIDTRPVVDDVTFQYIGSYSSGGYWNGFIGKVSFYDQSLGLAERTKLYNDFQNSYPIIDNNYPFYEPLKPIDLTPDQNERAGSTLIVNGVNLQDVSGWTAEGSAQLTAVNGKLRITNVAGTSTDRRAWQAISVVNGQRYRGHIISEQVSGDSPIFYMGTTTGTDNVVASTGEDGYFEFTATATTTYYFVMRVDNVLNAAGDFSLMILQPISGLVAGYNMRPKDGLLYDISTHGFNSTLVGPISSKDGMRFIDDDYAHATNDIIKYPLSFVFAARAFDLSAVQVLVGFADEDNANRYFAIYINTGGELYLSRRNTTPVDTPLGVDVVVGEVFVVACVVTNDTTVKIFINGEVALDSSSLTSVTFTSDFDKLLFGVLRLATPTAYLNGELLEAMTYDRALSDNEALAFCKKYDDRISLKETFDDEPLGSNLPLHWIPKSGQYELMKGTGFNYLECLSTGVSYKPSTQAYGVWEFDFYKAGAAVVEEIAFISDSQGFNFNGYYLAHTNAGTIELIRRDGASEVKLFVTSAAYALFNIWYGYRITRNSVLDEYVTGPIGTFAVYIKGGSFGASYTLIVAGGSGTNPVTDNTHTASTNQFIELFSGSRFSDESIKEANAPSEIPWVTGSGVFKTIFGSMDRYLENVTAGVIGVKNDQAFGTWEFDLLKVSTFTFARVAFIAETQDSYANYQGYNISFDSSERIQLLRSDGGGSGFNLFTTPAPYIELNVKYRIKVTRTQDGEFTVYIKGGVFGDDYFMVNVAGGTGSNPVTDLTYTRSKYFALNLEAGDQCGNILLHKGIK